MRDSAMAAIVMAAHAAATAIGFAGPPRDTEESHVVGAPKPDPLPHLADVTADLAARDAFLRPWKRSAPKARRRLHQGGRRGL